MTSVEETNLSEELDDACKTLALNLEKYLYSSIGAAKKDIKSREDLKKYFFKCEVCKKDRSVYNAVLLVTPLEINSIPKGAANLQISVSQRALLVCRDCVSSGKQVLKSYLLCEDTENLLSRSRRNRLES